MKRTAIFTAAVLMFAGVTSLSFASDNTATQSKEPSAVQSKSAVNPSSVGEKKTDTLPGKEQSAAPQKVEKVVQNSAPTAEKTVTEKKEASAPVAVKSGDKEKKVEPNSHETQPVTNPTK